jgi:hypothetical protein
MVKDSLEKLIENNNLGDTILDIKIPMEQTIEEKNGKKKVVLRKLIPSYVFIKMIFNNDLWYVITNIKGVTGFVVHDAGGGDAERGDVSFGNADVGAQLFTKCGDVCHDFLTGAGGKGGGAAFGNDLKAFVYNSGGDIGAAKVYAQTKHSKNSFAF